MANEIRLRSNNQSGTITDNPLAIGATTVNSAQFALLPVVDATNHLMLILDPLGVSGTPEIVKITAHTAASTTCTIVRAQEGSTARSFVFNTTWFHGPTVADYNFTDRAALSTNRPTTGLFAGQMIYETDTNRYLSYNGVSWIREAYTSTGGRTGCSVSRAANQSIASASETFVLWDTEFIDSDGFFAPTSDTITIPTGLGGIYSVLHNQFWSATANTRGFMALFVNGTLVGRSIYTGDDRAMASYVLPLSAGDTIKWTAFQQSGGALNLTSPRTEVYRLST